MPGRPLRRREQQNRLKDHVGKLRPLDPDQYFVLYESHCQGKEQYPTQASAEAVISAAIHHQEGFDTFETPDHLEAYPCLFTAPANEHWHIGNQ